MKQPRHRSAGVEQVDDLFPDHRIITAQDRRSACLQEIDVFIAVLVIQICSIRFSHTHRKRLVECQVMLHTARDILLGFLVYGLRPLALLIEIFHHHIIIIIIIHLPDRLAGQVL